MAHAAKEETQGFEILGHSMTRITVVGNGSYDEFQTRFDAAMPASTRVRLQVRTPAAIPWLLRTRDSARAGVKCARMIRNRDRARKGSFEAQEVLP